jgi:hypothetical protein
MTETRIAMTFGHLNFKPWCLFRISSLVLRISAAALAACISFYATAAAAAEVRLRSSAACATSVVRVADVAEIFSNDTRIAAALAEIPLCPAPTAGSQRVISQDEVRRLLELSGVEHRTALVTGSETVTVTIESAIGTGSLPKRPMIASGVRQAVFEIESDGHQGNRKPQVPSVSKQPTPPAATAKSQTTPPLVARGTLLTVNARTAGVRITTSGKALEAGSAGETIGIELADTKQRVLGRVLGPQLVEITAGGASD